MGACVLSSERVYAKDAPSSDLDARDAAAQQIRDDARAERNASKWLGWTVLATDVPAALVLGLGLGFGYSQSEASVSVSGGGMAAGVIGGLGYVLGAPIAHWTRGEAGSGWVSLALHAVGATAAAGVEIGLLQGDSNGVKCTFPSATGPLQCSSPNTGLPIAVAGLILAVPTVIDAVFMSTSHRKHEWSTTSEWMPILQIRDGGAVAGVAGTL
jgi:hypothetical protein